MDTRQVASSGIVNVCGGEGSDEPITLRHYVYALLVYALLTLVLTWPLVPNMGSKVALHPKLTIMAPYCYLYMLAWNHHALDGGLTHYWDANFFHPHPKVLTYLETAIFPSLATWPIHRLSGNPTLSYNVVVLSAFLLTALGTYVLLLELGISWRVAMPIGGAVAFCPYMLGEIYCVGTMLIQPVPFLLATMHRLIRRPTWPGAVMIGLCGMWLITSWYQYALLGSVFVLAWFIGFARRIPWRHVWYKLLVVGLVCGALIVPHVLTIKRTHRDMGFYHGPTLPLSWLQMLVPATGQRLYHDLLGLRVRERRGDLDPVVCFPGMTFAVLAAIGACFAVFGKASSDERRRQRYVYRYYLLVSMAAVVLSMGLWIRFGSLKIPGPYGLLFLTLPPFSSVRSVYRFFIFGQLFAALLAALGLTHCLAALRTRRARWAIGTAIAALLLIESAWIPLNLQPALCRPSDAPVLYTHLAKIDSSAPLIELPVPATVKRAPLDAMYTLNSIHTWQPLVNGYAGYFPGLYEELRTVLDPFPTYDGVRHLQALGVQYAIVHGGLMPAERVEAIKEFGDLRELTRHGKDVLYRLDNSARRSLNEWTGKTSLQLDAPRPGARSTAAQVIFDLDLREVIPVLPGDRGTRWKLTWSDANGTQVLTQSVAVRNSHWLTFKKNTLTASISLPKRAGNYTVKALDEITGSELGSCKVEVR